jgi:hypothetical protein
MRMIDRIANRHHNIARQIETQVSLASPTEIASNAQAEEVRVVPLQQPSRMAESVANGVDYLAAHTIGTLTSRHHRELRDA